MAITKIAGELLESNLIRTTDLAFNTNVLVVDAQNGRIGIGTDTPGNFKLDVVGNTRIAGDLTVTGTTTTVDSQNLSIEDNMIVLNSSGSVGNDSGVMINRGAAGNNAMMLWDENTTKFKFGTTTQDGSTTTDFGSVTLSKVEVGEPAANSDASTKKYVDDSVTSLSGTLSSNLSSGLAAVTGMTQVLSTPSDSSFGEGSVTSLTASTKVTEAIDALNETMENIRLNTYVKSVAFSSSATSISNGDTITLTITPTGNATRYDITWGDGGSVQTINDSGSSTTTQTHTYNTTGQISITVRAYNHSAVVTGSSGSEASLTRANYLAIATEAPVVQFQMYAASSGGSAITIANTGATVYLKNVTTNTANTNTFDVDWGDGKENTIASNSAAGGQAGARLAHTYTNAGGDDGSTVAGTGAGDTKYAIKLRLLTHPTAEASTFPQTRTNNFEVYSAHTTAYAGNSVRGINEESTSGFPVTFTNNTATLPGANSSFSATQQYTYNFDEGSTTVVAVGSNGAGDTSRTINNTFNLSSSQQNAGTTVTYNTTLTLATGHSGANSSAALNIIVEPDVRANIAATADKVSTGGSNNQYTLYDHTDLTGANRASATFTNTSKNADNYDYDFFSDSSSLVTIGEDGSTAGSIGTALVRNFTGTSAGNFTTRFRAYGTPDTFFQDDEGTISWTMKAVPSAPASLSSKSLTMSDAAQGTSPKLCHGFTDNTSSATTLSPGASLNTTVARRYSSTSTIDTTTVANAYNGAAGTLTAKLNATSGQSSSVTFSASAGENGTFNQNNTQLVVTNQKDYDEVVSAYPQDFYQVFTAKITKTLSNYATGLTAQRLEHSATGNTNFVHVLKDDITSTPTTAIGTVAEGTAGSKQYVSGIPYYDSGSPTVTVTGTTIANFTGQAYQDTNSPHEVDNDTNQESTSGNVITDSNFTYANVDGSTTMLSSGVPKSDTGVGGAYTIGAVTVPITGSSVKSVKTIRAKSKNANGTGSYNASSTKIQVYTASVSGLDNEAGGITVSDSLGNGSTHTDDALRITGFGSSSDTPSFNSSTNYYTGNAWSGAVTVAGTTEAISRFGTIKHFTTNLSSGYLPVGPNLTSGRDGGQAQYYTFAFRRTPVSQFSITMSGKVSGMFIAMPGTGIDSSSGASGWLNCSTQYNGSGQPGSGSGGNGSDGCAKTGGDRVVDNTTYSNKTFTFTLGTESLANSVGNTCLVRIKLNSGDSVTALSVGVAG